MNLPMMVNFQGNQFRKVLTCMPLKAIVADTGCGFQPDEALSYQFITTSPYFAGWLDEDRSVTYACTLKVHESVPVTVTPMRDAKGPPLSRGMTIRELCANR